MPLCPVGDVFQLDLADDSDPDAWWRRAQLPDDVEAPEPDALEQAIPVEFDEDGDRR